MTVFMTSSRFLVVDPVALEFPGECLSLDSQNERRLRLIPAHGPQHGKNVPPLHFVERKKNIFTIFNRRRVRSTTIVTGGRGTPLRETVERLPGRPPRRQAAPGHHRAAHDLLLL